MKKILLLLCWWPGLLFAQKQKTVLTNQSVDSLRQQLTGVTVPAFKQFLAHAAEIDRVKHCPWPSYSYNLLGLVIYHDRLEPVMQPLLKTGSQLPPDWKALETRIQKQFGRRLAEQVVLDAKINWAAYQKNWSAFSSYTVERAEKFGPGGPFIEHDYSQYNSVAWDLFERATDTAILEKALDYANRALTLSPVLDAEYLDTKANIFYKLGRVSQAIDWEQKAAALDTGSDIRQNLQKMRNGERTWPKD